jgi:hypothetical protein
MATLNFQIPINYEDVILSTLCSIHPKINRHYSRTLKISKKGRCSFCGKSGKTAMHHIVKRQDGGQNSINNLIELCQGCHNRADSGIINLKEQGKEFIFLIRKRNKILKKVYKINPLKFSEEYFNLIKKHIYSDVYFKESLRYRRKI